MKRLALVFLAMLAAACGSPATSHEYNNNDLVLAAQHAARDACSCVFVMGMDEEFCTAWVRASPDVARYVVDPQQQTVDAVALILWGARAHHENERFGCVLE